MKTPEEMNEDSDKSYKLPKHLTLKTTGSFKEDKQLYKENR